MKKVLFLNHNQENFGTYYRCLFLAKGLSQKGYRVKMLCASGKNLDLLVRRKKINDNFTIITLPRVKYHEYFTGQIIFRLPLAIFYVLFSKYDICHAFTVAQPQIGIPAWVAKKIRRKKLIVDWDDAWEDGFAEYHPKFVRNILVFFEQKTPKIADYVTYVSEYIGNKLEKIGISKKMKIVNGCNIDGIKSLNKSNCREKLRISQEKKIIVAMGNTYMNCLEVFFKALGIVFEREEDAFLYILSDFKVPKKFKKLFTKIKGNILLTGRVSFSDLIYYLSSADVLALPMENDAIEKARFPMRFGDYLCAGRPIVSNAVGEVKYYLEKYEAGITSPPGDYELMASNFLKVMDNPVLSEKMGKNARNLAETDLNWDLITDNLNQVYKSLYFSKK